MEKLLKFLKNNKNIILFIGLFALLTGTALATGGDTGVETQSDSGDLTGMFANVISGVGNTLFELGILIVMLASSLFIGAILSMSAFITISLDLFLIQIPDLSNLINIVAGKDSVDKGAFIQNVIFKTTTYITIFAVILWLFMGGLTYIKSVMANINNSNASDDEKRVGLVKFTFQMLLSLVLMVLIPYILKFLFFALTAIGTLLFTMSTAPLGQMSDEERTLMYKYPITNLFMATTDVDGPTRKKIFTEIEDGRKSGNVFSGVEKGLSTYSVKTSNAFQDLIGESADANKDSWFDGGSPGVLVIKIGKVMLIFMLVGMLMSVIVKLFIMFITRYVGIIIHSVFIPLNIVMLGTAYTDKVGLRSIVSYMGSLLMTPILYAIVGLGITILLTYKGNVGYILGTSNQIQGDLYLYGVFLYIIGYGVLTFLYQVLTNFGSELENIILGYSGRSGYDSGQDVSQGLGLAKGIGGSMSALSAGKMLFSGGQTIFKGVSSAIGAFKGGDGSTATTDLSKQAQEQGTIK